MPLSGGYFYPGLNNNVVAGDFNEIAIKQRGDTPDTIADYGFLFVSGSGAAQQLYFKDEAGTITAIAPSTASIDLYVTDELDLQGVLTSSTNDNQAKFSSSVDFLNTYPDYHINARNSHLVLSSSAGSHVVVSGALFSTGHVDIGNRESTITIAGTAIDSKLNVHTEGATDLGGLLLQRNSNTAAFGSHLILARTKGTEAAETATVADDKIGRIIGAGHDGTDHEIVAQIDIAADGNTTATSSPGRIGFFTTPVDATAEVERLRINSVGELVAPNSHMILSSSAGSIIHVSGTLEVEGVFSQTGFANAFATKTADYKLTTSDYIVAVDTSSNAIEIMLPTAGSIAGTSYIIKRINAGANVLTVEATGSETIDGAVNQLITDQWTTFGLVSDGTNWLIL